MVMSFIYFFFAALYHITILFLETNVLPEIRLNNFQNKVILISLGIQVLEKNENKSMRNVNDCSWLPKLHSKALK